MALPSNIIAVRIGVGESEYDEFGEQAAVTWKCGCGSRIKLEYFDHVEEEYVPIREERKAEWLAEHTGHKVLCFKCCAVEVEQVGYWCDSCESKRDDDCHFGPVIEF